MKAMTTIAKQPKSPHPLPLRGPFPSEPSLTIWYALNAVESNNVTARLAPARPA